MNRKTPVRPELFLFDLGGVLVDNVAFDRLGSTPGIAMNPTEIRSKWLSSVTVRSFELGELSQMAFAEAFVEEWRLPMNAQAFLAEFADWPKGFYPGALELIAELRIESRVACLSNSNAVHWAKFSNLNELFDTALSSHLLHAIKPDALCFQRALEECGVVGERVVFFDDSLENVVAAREWGIQAFQVYGLEGVKKVIQQSGWLQ